MTRDLDAARAALAAQDFPRAQAYAAVATAAAVERLLDAVLGATVPLARGLRSVRIRKED
jgi:hypothetical protein